jgi:hypothetical protein
MANLNDKELSNLLRQKFDYYNVALPDNDWEVLKKKWGDTQRNHRRFIWYWVAAASMIGIILSGLSYWVFLPSEQQLPSIAQTTLNKQNSSKITAVLSASVVTQKKETIFSELKHKKQLQKDIIHSISTTDLSLAIQPKSESAKTFTNIASTTQKGTDTLSFASSSHVNSPSSDVNSTDTSSTSTHYETLPQPTSLIDNSQDHSRKHAKKQPVGWLAINMQGSNGLPNGINNSNALMEPSTLDNRLFTQVNQNITPSANSSTQLITFIDKKTYAFPISWGISFSFPISDCWEVETGGMFTQLVTTGEVTSTSSSSATGRIEQNYIGIPLNVAYIFLKEPTFAVYGTAGGAVEKGVSLVEKIYSYNAQNVATETDHYTTTIHGFQYSLDGNIGASYRVYKFISGYIETGVAYFIPSNQPESYRTVHPFGVTIKVGIRFTFGKN